MEHVQYRSTDATTQAYLDGKRHFNKGDQVPITSKAIADVVKTEMTALKELPREASNLDRLITRIKHFVKDILLQIDAYKNAKISKKEAKSFSKALWDKKNNSVGPMGKYITGGNGENYGPASTKHAVDVHLSNGKTLYAGEQNAINIYTDFNFYLLNGTSEGYEASLNKWVYHRGGLDPSLRDGTVSKEEYLKEAQAHVPEILKVFASGMNKLPSYEGTVYRGDSMSNVELDQYRKGKITVSNRILSCTVDVHTGEQFARKSALGKIAQGQTDQKPVLYVIESKSSKDITAYSAVKSESERAYCPGQAFRAMDVDEETFPGLAIVYMKEISADEIALAEKETVNDEKEASVSEHLQKGALSREDVNLDSMVDYFDQQLVESQKEDAIRLLDSNGIKLQENDKADEVIISKLKELEKNYSSRVQQMRKIDPSFSPTLKMVHDETLKRLLEDHQKCLKMIETLEKAIGNNT